jgi:hypothetical protein
VTYPHLNSNIPEEKDITRVNGEYLKPRARKCLEAEESCMMSLHTLVE